MNGHYTDTDAITAVYLIAFSTLSGGSTNWTTMLEVACDWLAQTGIHEEQNPKLTLLSMSPAARFAAKATMVCNSPSLSHSRSVADFPLI